MAHFVGLYYGDPNPDRDAIDALYVSPQGTARVGLWGFIDTATGQKCTVKVVKGSGTVKSAELKGSRVLAFDVSGLSEGCTIQAFSGNTPFTEPLPIHRRSSSTIGAENKQLLESGDKANVCHIGGKPVKVIPLSKGFGGFKHIQQVAIINGLAVHITAGDGSLESFKSGYESGKSAHFTIDKNGTIAQYIAASFMSNAQGPGNENFLSVEVVGRAPGTGNVAQEMNDKQLTALKKLWGWVFANFPAPSWNLATVYTGQKNIGGLSNVYRDYSNAFVAAGYANSSSDSILTCINSTGLSCHYWLDNAPKACPGAGIMGQLPQVLGYPRVRVGGDEKHIAAADF